MPDQDYSEWMAECVREGRLTADEARQRVADMPFHLRGVTPPRGLTIGELSTEQVHPTRLLAELAEEFDRGIEV